MNYHAMDNALDILGHEKEILLPSESLEPESTSRIDKCDLRKSLAWDNAFFTNSGMLNPAETILQQCSLNLCCNIYQMVKKCVLYGKVNIVYIILFGQ